jgi:hypothetical protein
MKSWLEIRPAAYPEDYPAMVEVWNSCSDWQSKPENVAADDRSRNPELHFVRFVSVLLEHDEKKICGDRCPQTFLATWHCP